MAKLKGKDTMKWSSKSYCFLDPVVDEDKTKYNSNGVLSVASHRPKTTKTVTCDCESWASLSLLPKGTAALTFLFDFVVLGQIHIPMSTCYVMCTWLTPWWDLGVLQELSTQSNSSQELCFTRSWLPPN